ncbi:39714_t:CDS:2, partial [Gigaspora margarita]
MSVYSSNNDTFSEVSHTEYLEDLPGFDTSIDCSRFPSISIMAFNHFYVNPHLLKVWISYMDVIRGFGCDPNDEEFSLKLFLERTVILEQSSSDDTYDPTLERQDCYQEWESSSFLDLAPIEVEILNFFKGYSFEDSMVIESDRVSCEYFDGSISDSKEDNPVPPIMGKLDFSFLDSNKCHFCKCL